MPILLLLILLTALPLAAEPLKISYLKHPNVTGWALPLVQEAYQQAGIETQLFSSPSRRVIEDIDSGRSDGDVLISEQAIMHNPNIITVGPAITHLDIILLCNPEVVCNKTVLGDRNSVILATELSMLDIQKRYPRAKLNPFYNINLYTKLPEMLKSKRFNYAIYAISADKPMPKVLKGLNIVRFYQSKAFHVLAKRHQKIAKKLEKHLAKLLAEKLKKHQQGFDVAEKTRNEKENVKL